eukprot:GILI01021149.1.p1 GENE.GILI01021149.1~~GILI01021149.1.p1  ORF type:complete len:223 (-),score=42.62 GILI01021149.1:35-682(-)
MNFTVGNSVQDHIDSLRKQTEEAMSFNPIFLNCHSGKDSWSLKESEAFFSKALEVEKEFGVQICHETHRGRIFYNPWTTRDLLKTFPSLKLNCDYSHWVTVCERLIDTEKDILELCAERALHIHARVGHDQGPQVSDPRAPEFQANNEAHERWWKMIWRSQERRGLPFATCTPEYGPAPYQQTLPYTNYPTANLNDICNDRADRLKKVFAERHMQ